MPSLLHILTPNRTFLVRFGGISGEWSSHGSYFGEIYRTDMLYPNSAQNLVVRGI